MINYFEIGLTAARGKELPARLSAETQRTLTRHVADAQEEVGVSQRGTRPVLNARGHASPLHDEVAAPSVRRTIL
jgi:hypothetical protein